MNFKHFVRSGIIVSILYGIAAVVGYLTRLFLSHYVSIDLFGLFYSVLTFVLAFSIFCDLSLGQLLQIYIPQLRKKRQWGKIKGYITLVLGWNLIMRLIIIAMLIATAKFFAINYFKNPASEILIYLFAFAFLLSGFGSFSAGLIGFGFFRTVAFLNFFRILLYLFGLYAIFWIKPNLIAATCAYVFSVLATDIMTFILFIKRAMPSFFKIKMLLTKEMVFDTFKMGITLTLCSLALQVIGIADTLTITHFRPLAELGLYQMALPTATFITSVISWPINLMMPATIAYLEKLQQRKAIQQVSHFLLFSVIPITSCVIVFSGEILQILFNQSSTLGTWMLRLLAINQAIFLFIQFSISSLIGLKRVKELLKISIIITSIIVLLSILGGFLFNAIGIILGYLFSFIIFLLLARHTIHKFCGTKPNFMVFMRGCALSLICIAVMSIIRLLNMPVIFKLILVGICSLPFYFWLTVSFGLIKPSLIIKRFKRQ